METKQQKPSERQRLVVALKQMVAAFESQSEMTFEQGEAIAYATSVLFDVEKLDRVTA